MRFKHGAKRIKISCPAVTLLDRGVDLEIINFLQAQRLIRERNPALLATIKVSEEANSPPKPDHPQVVEILEEYSDVF